MKSDNITADELKSILDDKEHKPLVLHIFDDKKFEQEHIPKSFSAPLKRLEIVPDLVEEKNREIILYGENDNTSQPSSAVDKLQNLGFTNLKVLTGGLDAWKKEGYPLQGKKYTDEK